MPETTTPFDPWKDQLAKGRALVESGDFNISTIRAAAAAAGLSDDALIIGQMLQPASLEAAIICATAIQHYADGLISLDEAQGKIDALESDEGAEGDLADDEGDEGAE